MPLEDEDSIVVLRNATWADFERMLEIRGENSAPRLAYSEGCLEIMSPSQTHERVKSTIGRLVEVWMMEHGVDWTPLGSWTLKKEAEEKGAEPDECYVFGTYESTPERPDLAIEVIWTSGGIDKRKIYQAIGVPELWFWDDDQLQLFELRDGKYVSITESVALPGIDLAELLTFVHVRPTSKAVRAYRAALAKPAT